MSKKKRLEKEKDKKTAKERINNLFLEAEKKFDIDPNLSHRYVFLARKIAMKHQITIPRSLKRRFCNHCYHFLVPSKNCRVRINSGKVIYHCLDCKKFMRFALKK